jgi:hypothetical protein
MSRTTTVLLVLLAILAAWIGYNAYRDRQAALARAEWQRVTDSLITAGVIKDSLSLAYYAQIDKLEQAARDALTAQANAEARAGKLSLGARTLRATLDSARTALDSLPLAVAVIQKQDTLLALKDSSLTEAHAATTSLTIANAMLRQRITSDSGRIVALTHQLMTVPKPVTNAPNMGFLSFLSVRLRPCAFAGLTTQGETRAGLGVCLTK